MKRDFSGWKAGNLARCVDGQSDELLEILRHHPEAIASVARVTDCIRNGYAPSGYGLADFSIVHEHGLFHLFHIPRVPGNSCIDIAHEHWLGHAVSTDLDTWTTKNPVLCVEAANYFESGHLWAPFVLEHAGAHYMFYTGLSAEPSQVLCLATSSDPALEIWTRDIRNPILPLDGFEWQRKNSFGHLRQARDPHVANTGDHFLLAYTTMHANGCPAVGGLVSEDLQRWDDVGPILYRPLKPGAWMPESVNIQHLPDGNWALIVSMSPGLEVYVAEDPHCWHDAQPIPIAYSEKGKTPVAPEVLGKDDERGEWLVAYFEAEENRLFFGLLNTQAWTLRKLRSAVETGRLSRGAGLPVSPLLSGNL